MSPAGAIYVADLEAAALLRFAEDGFEVVAQGEGLPRTPLFGIRHIAPDDDGTVVASDPATMALYRISSGGDIAAIPDDERFVTPWGVALTASGDLLAVDRVTQRLRRVRADSIEDVAEIRAPRAILAGSDGSLHVLTDRNVLRVEGAASEPLVLSPPFEFPHDFAALPTEASSSPTATPAASGRWAPTEGFRCWRAASRSSARRDRAHRRWGPAGRRCPRPRNLPHLPGREIRRLGE